MNEAKINYEDKKKYYNKISLILALMIWPRNLQMK